MAARTLCPRNLSSHHHRSGRAFDKPYFAKQQSQEFFVERLGIVRRRALDAALAVTVSGVATHPEDDLALATAVSASADLLVTGDRQLLNLGAYAGVTILSPRDFLDLLDGQAAVTTPTPPR